MLSLDGSKELLWLRATDIHLLVCLLGHRRGGWPCVTGGSSVGAIFWHSTLLHALLGSQNLGFFQHGHTYNISSLASPLWLGLTPVWLESVSSRFTKYLEYCVPVPSLDGVDVSFHWLLGGVVRKLIC